MVADSSLGTREIAAADFFVDTVMSALEPGEILTDLRIPKVGAGTASAYDKLAACEPEQPGSTRSAPPRKVFPVLPGWATAKSCTRGCDKPVLRMAKKLY